MRVRQSLTLPLSPGVVTAYAHLLPTPNHIKVIGRREFL